MANKKVVAGFMSYYLVLRPFRASSSFLSCLSTITATTTRTITAGHQMPKSFIITCPVTLAASINLSMWFILYSGAHHQAAGRPRQDLFVRPSWPASLGQGQAGCRPSCQRKANHGHHCECCWSRCRDCVFHLFFSLYTTILVKPEIVLPSSEPCTNPQILPSSNSQSLFQKRQPCMRSLHKLRIVRSS